MLVRKKPVEVEAQKIDELNYKSIAEWCGALVKYRQDNYEPHLQILTLEGAMTAYIGDWVIKGVKGEFYPCKADIFEKTYDIVEEDKMVSVPTLEVVSINEQEDGSAFITFDMDTETMKLFAGIGIKKVIMDSIAETLKNES